MVFLAYAAPAFPLPAGVIGASPWLDLTHCFPSARINRGLDYLPNPWEGPAATIPSPAWPLPEPRYHYYSDDPLHPLVYPSKFYHLILGLACGRCGRTTEMSTCPPHNW